MPGEGSGCPAPLEPSGASPCGPAARLQVHGVLVVLGWIAAGYAREHVRAPLPARDTEAI